MDAGSDASIVFIYCYPLTPQTMSLCQKLFDIRGMSANRCHIELSKIPTPEQIQEVEDRSNLYIRRDYPIRITFADQRPASLPKGNSKCCRISQATLLCQG